MVDRHILWGIIFLTFYLLFKLPRVDGPLVKGISLLLFIRYCRKIKLRFTGSLAALIAIYIWAASSIQWSIDKASTLNAIVDHFWCIFLALMLAMACRFEKWKDIYKWLLIIIVMWNVKALLLNPGQALTHMGFAGIYGHKNYAGLYLGVSFISFVGLGMQNKLEKISAAISLIFLFFTLSKTSIMGALGSAFLIMYYKKKGLNHLFNRYTVVTALIVLNITLFNIPFDGKLFIDQLMSGIHEHSFTGRGGLWKSVMLLVADPVTGLGFNGLWGGQIGRTLGMTSNVALENPLWFEMQISIDGGFVDLYLDLGLVGICLVLLFILLFLKDLSMHKPTGTTQYFLGMLLFFIFHNIFESSVMKIRLLLWFVMVWGVFILALKNSGDEVIRIKRKKKSNRFSYAYRLFRSNF